MNAIHNNHKVSLAPTYLKKKKQPRTLSLIENINEVPVSQVCNFFPARGNTKRLPLMLQSKLHV